MPFFLIEKCLKKTLPKGKEGNGEQVWHRLKESHPIAYEVAQWAILGLAVAALIAS